LNFGFAPTRLSSGGSSKDIRVAFGNDTRGSWSTPRSGDFAEDGKAAVADNNRPSYFLAVAELSIRDRSDFGFLCFDNVFSHKILIADEFLLQLFDRSKWGPQQLRVLHCLVEP
jgi:hypothetical protein